MLSARCAQLRFFCALASRMASVIDALFIDGGSPESLCERVSRRFRSEPAQGLAMCSSRLDDVVFVGFHDWTHCLRSLRIRAFMLDGNLLLRDPGQVRRG